MNPEPKPAAAGDPSPTACPGEPTLRALIDDRLPAAEAAAIADHLEACERCRESVDRLAAESRWWLDARALADGAIPASKADDDRIEPLPTIVHPIQIGAAPDPGTAADDLGFLEPPDPENPDQIGRFGPYEVISVLGRGGMGIVLKAFDPALHRVVAIKVLAPQLAAGADARRRFVREGRAAASVCHEHVVTIHAVDELAGLPYLVMQYVGGKTLQGRIDRDGPLDAKEVLRIGMQAASGLAAAHAQGLVHRDVKPGNILLENGVERVKLTDFGLARAVDDPSLTQAGIVAGTPEYMAPEQARGEPLDGRADLFALGAVLYAMATGRSPFRASSTMAVLRKVCDEDPRPIRALNPDVPPWLAAIIARLLAKDPTERYATAAEVAALLSDRLSKLQRGLPIEPERSAVPTPIVGMPTTLDPSREVGPEKSAPRRRRRLAVAGSMLLGLSALGLTEASGLTNVGDLVATVLRIKTPDGTLVLELADPEMSVEIDGGDVVLSGGGVRAIRVTAGTHKLRPIRGDQEGPIEIVEVVRDGRRLIHAYLEGDEPRVSIQGLRTDLDQMAVPPHPPGMDKVHADLAAANQRLGEANESLARLQIEAADLDPDMPYSEAIARLRAVHAGEALPPPPVPSGPGFRRGLIEVQRARRQYAEATNVLEQLKANILDPKADDSEELPELVTTRKRMFEAQVRAAQVEAALQNAEARFRAAVAGRRDLKAEEEMAAAGRAKADRARVIRSLRERSARGQFPADPESHTAAVVYREILRRLTWSDLEAVRRGLPPRDGPPYMSDPEISVRLDVLREVEDRLRRIQPADDSAADQARVLHQLYNRVRSDFLAMWHARYPEFDLADLPDLEAYGPLTHPADTIPSAPSRDESARSPQEAFRSFVRSFVPGNAPRTPEGGEGSAEIPRPPLPPEGFALADLPSPSGSDAPPSPAESPAPPRVLDGAAAPARAGISLKSFTTLPIRGGLAVAADPIGPRFVVVTAGGFELHDDETGQTVDILQTGLGERPRVGFAPDGGQFAVGGGDGTITFWEADDLEGDDAAFGPVATIEAHDGPVTALAFAPDGRTFVSAGSDGTLKFRGIGGRDGEWEFDAGAPIRALAFHPETPEIVGVVLAPEGSGPTFKLYRIEGKDLSEMVASTGNQAGVDVAFDPKGRYVAVGHASHIDLVDADGKGPFRSWPPVLITKPDLVVIACSPDGRFLVAGGSDGWLSVWDRPEPFGNHKVPYDLLEDHPALTDLTFLSDGRLLTVGPGAVEVWTIEPETDTR